MSPRLPTRKKPPHHAQEALAGRLPVPPAAVGRLARQASVLADGPPPLVVRRLPVADAAPPAPPPPAVEVPRDRPRARRRRGGGFGAPMCRGLADRRVVELDDDVDRLVAERRVDYVGAYLCWQPEEGAVGGGVPGAVGWEVGVCWRDGTARGRGEVEWFGLAEILFPDVSLPSDLLANPG